MRLAALLYLQLLKLWARLSKRGAPLRQGQTAELSSEEGAERPPEAEFQQHHVDYVAIVDSRPTKDSTSDDMEGLHIFS